MTCGQSFGCTGECKVEPFKCPNYGPASDKAEVARSLVAGEHKTRLGHRVRLNQFAWSRADFTYLGKVYFSNGHSIGWAWHHDGRSIDREDRGFDLVDFHVAH